MSVIALDQLTELVSRVEAAAGDDPAQLLATVDALMAWCQAARVQCVRSLADTESLHRVGATPLRSQRETDAMVRATEVARQVPQFLDLAVRR